MILAGKKQTSIANQILLFRPAQLVQRLLIFCPARNLELSLLSKYVSKQYLDNTQNESRRLNPFYTQDVRAIYTIKKIPIVIGRLKELNITGQVNNIFNKKYEPNGYTFSYIYGGETVTENYYFPMAGTNFMIGVNVKL